MKVLDRFDILWEINVIQQRVCIELVVRKEPQRVCLHTEIVHTKMG